MKTSTVEALVWVLVYGGGLTAALGLSVQRAGNALGHVLVTAGALAVVLGVALIYVRSRMKDSPKNRVEEKS
ncbi:MAG TPA: hypothetical protein VE029_05555 [Rhizobacter sp.]|nr:hypothetical protein [Rhizobacter sp.]